MYNYTMLLTNKGMGLEASFIHDFSIETVIKVMCEDCMEALYNRDGITKCLFKGIISNTDTKISYEFEKKAEIEVKVITNISLTVDEGEAIKEVDYKTAEQLMN